MVAYKNRSCKRLRSPVLHSNAHPTYVALLKPPNGELLAAALAGVVRARAGSALTAETLSAVLPALTDPATRRPVAIMGAALRAEEGVGAAVCMVVG